MRHTPHGEKAAAAARVSDLTDAGARYVLGYLAEAAAAAVLEAVDCCPTEYIRDNDESDR